MSVIDQFARDGLIALHEPVCKVVIQAVAILFVSAKIKYFLQRRDHTKAKGQSASKFEQLKYGVAKAHADGHLSRAPGAMLRKVFDEELAAGAKRDCDVLGSSARNWSADTATLQQSALWEFLRPMHIDSLYAHLGSFTHPSAGVFDGYDKVLSKYNSGVQFLRTLFEKESGEQAYF